MDKKEFEKLARLIRYYILVSTTAAGSGHATSSLSSVELATMLFFKYLRADVDDFDNFNNDRFILSKGHASPLLYALYAAAGKITEEELLKLRTFDSPLEGHPTPRFPFAEAATGSLGQGLSIGVGEALATQKGFGNILFRPLAPSSLNEVPTPTSDIVQNSVKAGLQVAEKNVSFSLPRVFVLLGDGEMAEGQVWEAAALASYHKLHNVIAIVDVNRLGQSQETMYGKDAEVYRRKFEAFGWGVIVVDGHNGSEIDAAYTKALEYKAGPVAIIGRTIKGKGVSFLEDKNGWHGKALSKEELARALEELGEVDKNTFVIPSEVEGSLANASLNESKNAFGAEVASSNARVLRSPPNGGAPSAQGSHLPKLPAPEYTVDKPVATRRAFGNALVRLGESYPQMVVLDGDVQNSTYAELFAKTFPDRFIECFIAEQNMVSVAVGLFKRGMKPWVSTFACFLTRAFDQIRLSAVSGATIRFNGTHAGVSIGADGPSQMGLEDIALFRSVHGSTVLYPADAFATERLVEEMMKNPPAGGGISYIRTTRPETPIVYTKDDQFEIGGSKVHEFAISDKQKAISKTKNSDVSLIFYNLSPVVTVVAAGITLYEALKAQKQLAGEGIAIRVIDCYSIKPIDGATLKKAARETKAIIVVEDHYPEGGLGEAVQSAILNQGLALKQFIHLAVHKMPRSGTPQELLHYEEIDSDAITQAVKRIIE